MAEFCAKQEISACISVASRYGRELVPPSPFLRVMEGRMTEEEMADFIKKSQITLVVDATHPYALEVTENIKKACKEEGAEYLRCLREERNLREKQEGICYVRDVEEAVSLLEKTTGNIFVTTGSKELVSFTHLPEYRERVFARVLPSLESVEHCCRLGISGKHLICMQGPFSRELNTAMMRQIGAKWMVTKETGKNGGFDEKLAAASEAGASCVVIGLKREETGMGVEKVKERLLLEFGRGEKEKGEKDLHVVLAGIGPGNLKQMTQEVKERILESRILLGAPRMLEAAKKVWEQFQGQGDRQDFPKMEAIYLPRDVIAYLEDGQKEGTVTVLFSGDTGFYSGSRQLIKALREKQISFEILPGISSLAYFASQLQISWEDAALLTAHGRDLDIKKVIARIEKEKWLFILLSGTKAAGEICRTLAEEGFGSAPAALGERLSYEDERITRGTVREISDLSTDSLAVLAVKVYKKETE